MTETAAALPLRVRKRIDRRWPAHGSAALREEIGWDYLSAVWELVSLPALTVARYREHGQLLWRVRCDPYVDGPAARIGAQLRAQAFPTRRAALQAIAGLLVLDDA